MANCETGLLIKIMGMLHTDMHVLNHSLEEQLHIAADRIFSTLKDVQKELAK